MARCKYCNKEIVWMPEGRKKIPVEVDGIKHECDEYKNSVGSGRQVELSDIDPEVLKMYQDRINKKK